MSYPTILPTIGHSLAEEIDDELHRAKKHGLKFNSMHEAYSVILEELDEVWEIVKQKQSERNITDLRKELIQVAAMAIKAIQSLDNTRV